jgi:hypothetical protein
MLQNVFSDSKNNFLIIIGRFRTFDTNVIYKRQVDVRNMLFQNLRDDPNELRYRIRCSLQYDRLSKKAERYYKNSHVPALKVQLNVVVTGKKIDKEGYSASYKLF